MRVFAKTLILLAMLGALTVAYAQSNAPPRADFRFSPQNPDTNTIITFDASSSRDPDGTIVKYEWDFNGDGKIRRDQDDPHSRRGSLIAPGSGASI
jgi:PKD repeat protein